MSDYRNRWRAMAASPDRRDWYRIFSKKSEKTARIDIYDFIGYDPWFDEGIGAKQFVKDLAEVKASTIELHINSPGGDIYDGIAIYNALKDHDATVNVVVDALAASAASLIAMAGDEIVMNTASQMMVHEPWTWCIGGAKDMKAAATRLEKHTTAAATLYAGQAGGSAEDWLEPMSEETWYTAEEAVEAGLADRVVEAAQDGDKTQARFDLTVFNHAGRENAPKPRMIHARSSVNSRRNGRVFDIKDQKVPGTFADNKQEGQLTPEQLAKLGLPEDATQEQIDARLDELTAVETALGDGNTDEAGSNDVDSEAEAETGVVASVDTAPASGTTSSEAQASIAKSNVVQVDRSEWERAQAAIGRFEEREKAQAAKDADVFLSQAVKDGKFAPARREAWAKAYKADPEGTIATINGLEKGLIPVTEIGHGADVNSAQDDSYPTQALSATEREAINRARQGATQ